MKSDRELRKRTASFEKRVLEVESSDGTKRKFRPVRAEYNDVWMQIASELAEFLKGRGVVYDDYVCSFAGRELCSTVAVFTDSAVPRQDGKAPPFAISVSDSGRDPKELSRLRSDLFTAGTVLHWHVDIKRKCIQSCDAAGVEKVFYLSDEASAEGLLPGWCAQVSDFFYMYAPYGSEDGADSRDRKTIESP